MDTGHARVKFIKDRHIRLEKIGDSIVNERNFNRSKAKGKVESKRC